MSLSTPIAYPLGHAEGAFVVNSTSSSMRFRFLDLAHESGNSNGTGAIMYGFETPIGRITYGIMFPSVKLDELTSNIEYSPKFTLAGIHFAGGVQDAGDTTGTFRPFEPRSSRSFYFVATKNFGLDTYVSAGFGNQRFRTAFWNISQNLGRDWKAVAEFDSFNWNYGLARRLPSFDFGGRMIHTTAFVGYIRGKYASWSLAFNF
jgi:hypothetical protein